jgi:hydrogenase-4 component F
MELVFIFSSLLFAAAACLVARKRVIIELISVFASIVAFISSLFVAFRVAMTGTYTPYSFLAIDALGAIMVLIISLVGLAAMVYSVFYLREETAKKIVSFTQVKLYYILINLFLTAMFFAVTSINPIFTWISIESTTLSTAFLISFYNKPHAIEAAWKYLVINSIGLLLGFFGTLLFFTSLIGIKETGFATWNTLLLNAAHFDPTIAKIAFVFIIVGYGTKVGLAPMHTWLPDAHSNAPAPISALLSGVLLNVAFVAMLRFKLISDVSTGPAFSQKLLIAFGLLSIVIASLINFTQKKYKRLLAYHSIENMGIATVGIGFGGIGVFAAILHMIYHALIKSALFLLSGTILLKYSSTKISSIKGALTALPVTSVLFLIGFFIITGTPPFGMFLTKTLVFSAGIKSYTIITIVALFSAAILFISFFNHATNMAFGEKPAEVKAGEGPVWLVIPPLVLIAVVVFLSFYIPPILNTLLQAAVANFQ